MPDRTDNLIRRESQSFSSYLFVLALMLAALGLTYVIYPYVAPMSSPLFLFAVVVIAWRHGLRHAVLGTFLAGVLIDFFFIPPQNQLSMGANDIVRLTIFFLEGVGFSLLINSRKLATEAVRESREQLLALSMRDNSAREEERRRLSLEVHDELGQSLTSLKMQLHLLKTRVSADSSIPSRHELAKEIEPLLSVVGETIGSVRRIATELRPPILDDLGLVPALEWQMQEFTKTSGLDISFKTNVDSPSVASQTATAFFRIFQEALTNVMRHADASRVSVSLLEADDVLRLTVEDDGRGIRSENRAGKSSLGILGMRERARNIGGSLEVIAGTERGTVVRLSAPVGVQGGGNS